jgi:hypothetical protein
MLRDTVAISGDMLTAPQEDVVLAEKEAQAGV